MTRHPAQSRARIAQTVSRLRSLVHPETIAPDRLELSERTDRRGWTGAQALAYAPAALGAELGPLWATYWFRVGATVPDAWAGERVDLLWDSGSEATVWEDGRVVQGVYTGWRALREVAPVREPATAGERIELAVEVACNSWAGDEPPLAPGADPALAARWRLGRTWAEPTADAAGRAPVPAARLERCALGRFDPEAWGLLCDLELLAGLEAEPGLDHAWAATLLHELDAFCTAWDAADRATWRPARAILAELLDTPGAGPRHTAHAIGHAHVDTAWVWPLPETRRKLVRTAANQLALMDRYPEHRYAASSAQHYAWLEEDAPDLFARVAERVAEGRWEVVGGAWVEPDCNLPTGESLVRQLLYGQRWFERRFGARCSVYWSPDTFGHHGQLPQILRAAGIGRFVTQKLAWNQFTHPPHDSFRWRGTDGSEVLAHLPPVKTYNSELTPAELRAGDAAFQDHDRSAASLVLFGHGDGGGGPTPEMLERARRLRDLRGVPAVEVGRSDAFFARLEAEPPAPAIVGELYFEYHRGTYTSQARTKRGNREGERLLHEAEAAAALAWAAGAGEYPEFEPVWRDLLRNQFHDILPGTSLREVHALAERELATVAERATALRDAALAALAPRAGGSPRPVNLTAFARRDVLTPPGGEPAVFACPPYGAGVPAELAAPVTAEPSGAGVVLDNGTLRAELDAGGRLVSLRLGDREALAGPAGVLELYEDRPTAYDAWELEPYHEQTRAPCPPAEALEIVAAGPLRAEVAFRHRIGAASTLEQRVRLDADAARLEVRLRVDWRERHRVLKAAFPFAVHATAATYGAPFGVHVRPAHRNTTADFARYEVPAHGFADVSEHGFGVALLSGGYGFSADGATLRHTLLRSPTDPDPEADQGEHELAYALFPHAGGWQDGGVVAEAARFLRPPGWVAGAVPAGPLAQAEPAGLVLDTLKRAEDGTELVLRLYEAHGGRGTGRVRLAAGVAAACRANALEDPGEPLAVEDGAIVVPYRPFELITLRVRT